MLYINISHLENEEYREDLSKVYRSMQDILCQKSITILLKFDEDTFKETVINIPAEIFHTFLQFLYEEFK